MVLLQPALNNAQIMPANAILKYIFIFLTPKFHEISDKSVSRKKWHCQSIKIESIYPINISLRFVLYNNAFLDFYNEVVMALNRAIRILEEKYGFEAEILADEQSVKEGRVTEEKERQEDREAARLVYHNLHGLQRIFKGIQRDSSAVQEGIYHLIDGIVNHKGKLKPPSADASESSPLASVEQDISEILLNEKFDNFEKELKQSGYGAKAALLCRALGNSIKAFFLKILPFGCGVGAGANIAAGAGYAAATGVAMGPLSSLAATGAITGSIVMSGFLLFKSYTKYKRAENKLHLDLNETKRCLDDFNTALNKKRS